MAMAPFRLLATAAAAGARRGIPVAQIPCTLYTQPMGLIRGTAQLSNPTRPEPQGLEVSGHADPGAVHLCIPVHVAT